MSKSITRRAALVGLASAIVTPAVAETGITDDLVAAAQREGTAVFHTSIDLPVAQKMVSAFEALYTGIRIQLERSGAERILQRIEQEYASHIHAADVVESSDITMFLTWKQNGWMASHTPSDVARFWPAEERDKDGQFAAVRAVLSVIAYNTRQVKPEDAPNGFADLLAPKWRNRIVKAHPSYSGTILTSTFATANAMGWEYFEKLAKQKVLQVQSGAEPPKKVAQGERSVEFDGTEYVALYLKETGNPIEVVYAVEGSPLISGQAGVLAKAPHPNAARLFNEFMFSAACQQVLSDLGGMRSFHPAVKLPPGRRSLSDIKLLRTDPGALLKEAENVKAKYSDIFGV